MQTTHTPVRRLPTGLTALCLLAALLFTLPGIRGCVGHDTTNLPAVTTIPPPPPERPGGGIDPTLPGIALAQCPQRVRDMVSHLRSVPGWASKPGVRGGRIFRNLEGRLPAGPRYREYDLTAGLPRNAERIVVSADKRHFYWTQDHYHTFTHILLP